MSSAEARATEAEILLEAVQGKYDELLALKAGEVPAEIQAEIIASNDKLQELRKTLEVIADGSITKAECIKIAQQALQHETPTDRAADTTQTGNGTGSVEATQESSAGRAEQV